jgi:hypothetical protein
MLLTQEEFVLRARRERGVPCGAGRPDQRCLDWFILNPYGSIILILDTGAQVCVMCLITRKCS